jgi:hypothetical protein
MIVKIDVFSEIDRINRVHEAEKHFIYQRYVEENARFKIGDIVGNIIGILKVEKIIYRVHERFKSIEIAYKGRRYKKNKGVLSPTKNNPKHEITDYDNKSLKLI